MDYLTKEYDLIILSQYAGKQQGNKLWFDSRIEGTKCPSKKRRLRSWLLQIL